LEGYLSKTKILYEGNLRTVSTHESGSILETDAPKDNQGKGERFSPTDLLAVALGSCILTLMGIVAKRLEVDLKGTSIEVEKVMSSTPPRRIAKLMVSVRSPLKASADVKNKLEQAGLTCPVKQSLHPDIQIQIDFHWG
jgi:putative redox protein